MEEDSKKEIIALSIRAAVTIALILIGKLRINEDFSWWGNLIIMLSAYFIIGYDIIIKAFKSIFIEHEIFNECMLMLLASVGAFALRAYGPEHNEYMEGVLVILLYQIGEMFEDLAEEKSKDAITKAIDLRKDKANVEIDGKIIEKESEKLVPGDIVVVGNGMKILCDGVVISGSGETDESSLTGEFILISKKEGDKVVSGSILKSGSLKVKVSKPYSESTIAKLLDLVENSAEKKSKATRFITKFSKYYTPIITLLALLVAIVPPLFLGISSSKVWADWIYTALSFLVVSCPCAIVISVPLAYFSGLGLASKNGILVKGAGYFDKLEELKKVAFDKTGTLTKGEFSIKEVTPVGVSKDEMLEYVAAAESNSTHPIAKSLVSSSEFDSNQIEEYVEEAGSGVGCVYKGHKVKVGKASYCNGVDIEGPGARVYVSIDDKCAGYITLVDQLKSGSKECISGLKENGITTYIVSGDKKENALEIGKELGVDVVKYELRPEEKVSFLHSLIDEDDGSVAYVGDGINDAPSIVLADVGIAMGGLGSDVAVENADCVIMNDDPSKVVSLIKVAHKTRNRAAFNIAVSLIVKFAVMILAVIASIMGTWSLPLFVAVLADSGLAMLMILSSLLLGFSKIKK